MRPFPRIHFTKEYAEYNAKLTEILAIFSHMQLISIANLFHLDFLGTETETATRIHVDTWLISSFSTIRHVPYRFRQ